MNCKQIRPLLSRHVDGESSPEDAAAIRRHLTTCARCSDSLRELQRCGFLLQRFFDDKSLSEHFTDAVLERAGSGESLPSPARPSRRFSPLWWISAAAVALFALCYQFLSYQAPPRWDEAQVTLIRPPVMRQLPDTETWSELTGQGYLLPGGALQTWQGGMVEVDFGNDRSLLLNEYSQFKLHENGPGGRIAGWVQQGEAVARFLQNTHPFLLETPVGKVSGTASAVSIRVLPRQQYGFLPLPKPRRVLPQIGNLGLSLPDFILPAFAASEDRKMIVTVQEGEVLVENRRGSIELSAGTQTVLRPGELPTTPVKVDVSRVLAWARPPRLARDPAAVPKHSPASPAVQKPAAPDKSPATRPARERALVPPADSNRLQILPPIIVKAGAETGRIVITWEDDAAMNTPVYGYDILRGIAESGKPLERLNQSILRAGFPDGPAHRRASFVDGKVRSNVTYLYRVKALALPEGEAGTGERTDRDGLLESPASAPVIVKAAQDFKLVLTGWTEQPMKAAQILVQKWHRGRFVGRHFLVRKGQEVGYPCTIAIGASNSSPDYVEEVDFSTGYVLLDLQEVRQPVPGSKKTPSSRKPLTLPAQKAILQGRDGETTELVRQP